MIPVSGGAIVVMVAGAVLFVGTSKVVTGVKKVAVATKHAVVKVVRHQVAK